MHRYLSHNSQISIQHTPPAGPSSPLAPSSPWGPWGPVACSAVQGMKPTNTAAGCEQHYKQTKGAGLMHRSKQCTAAGHAVVSCGLLRYCRHGVRIAACLRGLLRHSTLCAGLWHAALCCAAVCTHPCDPWVLQKIASNKHKRKNRHCVSAALLTSDRGTLQPGCPSSMLNTTHYLGFGSAGYWPVLERWWYRAC